MKIHPEKQLQELPNQFHRLVRSQKFHRVIRIYQQVRWMEMYKEDKEDSETYSTNNFFKLFRA